jgi:methylphosphotriester-DNA--protein-cysteine methyltransferase
MPTKRHANDAFNSLSPLRLIKLYNAANRLVCSHLYDEPPTSNIQCFCESYGVSPKEMRRYCVEVYNCTPIELLDWARGLWMLKEIDRNSSVKFLVIQIRLGYEHSRGAFWTFQKRVFGRAGRKLKQELEPARVHLNTRFAKLAEIVK